MNNPTACPRFTVREFGPRDFALHDNVTKLEHDFFFTRRVAEETAARRNAACSTAPEGTR